jgi:hypothetical protein
MEDYEFVKLNTQAELMKSLLDGYWIIQVDVEEFDKKTNKEKYDYLVTSLQAIRLDADGSLCFADGVLCRGVLPFYGTWYLVPEKELQTIEQKVVEILEKYTEMADSNKAPIVDLLKELKEDIPKRRMVERDFRKALHRVTNSMHSEYNDNWIIIDKASYYDLRKMTNDWEISRGYK